MRWLLWLPLLSCCLFGTMSYAAETKIETIDDLVKKLADEDFDVRERATAKLAEYPAEYTPIFLKMSHAWKNDMEVMWRLKVISYIIWERNILTKSNRWRRLHGSIGIAFDYQWVLHWDHQEEGGPARPHQTIGGIWVTSVSSDGPSLHKIEEYDMIVAIDGVSIEDLYSTDDFAWGLFKPGETYKITIKRPKDKTKLENGSWPSTEDAYNEPITVDIIAGFEDPRVLQNRYKTIWQITKEEWYWYLDYFNKTYGEDEQYIMNGF